jgi:hypothetical protein
MCRVNNFVEFGGHRGFLSVGVVKELKNFNGMRLVKDQVLACGGEPLRAPRQHAVP